MTIRRIAWAVALSLALAPPALAQRGAQPDHGGVDARFQALEMPTPNAYRTAAGRPGPAYWQQRADYDIRATLDPATNTVTGSETITYANHSPDTLRYVWLQLDQNLFAPGSEGAQTFPSGGRFGGGGFQGGITVEKVAGPDGKPLVKRIRDTMMRVDLAKPLAPGATTTLALEWSFPVPESGGDRMGHDGDHYLIAQWYPRMAVYDDVHGWNTLPYLGQGEFYLEYGDFDVALTVPATYLVGATGTLQNPDQVLTATERQRLDQARKGSDIVAVVTPDELADKAAIRPKTEGTLTWKFHAGNVRDFAWGASPETVWDATSTDGVLVQALYRPEAVAWREAAEMTRHSIRFYSDRIVPYPWPAATALEGPVLGMEYPMVVFVAPQTPREDLFDTLDHEWGHSWFPMLVGSDERRHAWMDEGFNTFINQFSKKDFFPESTPFLLNVAQYVQAVRAFGEQPLSTRPDRFESQNALGIAGYVKPAVMLNALRALAGGDAFDAAFSDYARTWSFRHPQPADFVRVMENDLGLDLGTFFHEWLDTTGTFDVAILGQDQHQSDGRWQIVVTVDQRGDMVMPAVVTATTESGASDTVTIPADAFYGTDRATATLTLPDKATKIVVDGGPEWGDANPQNNTWKR